METVFNIIQRRRSIRKFLPVMVEKKKIDQILQAALMAPTSKNSCPWHFIVVDNTALLQQLSTARQTGSSFLLGTSTAIVVACDPTSSDAWLENASIASAFMLLQAEELGLGGCWIQIARRQRNDEVTANEFIHRLLSIPDELIVVNIIALGYKADKRSPHSLEKLLYDRIHYNTF